MTWTRAARGLLQQMKRATDHLKKHDATLAGVIDAVGPCRITYRPPTFEALARSIVFQQLNGKAASTIYARVEEACGHSGVCPEAILKMRAPRMKAAGLSAQKTAYLKDLAQRTADGSVDFARLAGLTDDEVVQTLTQVKGVGTWTVHMFLIFALRRMDVLPTGDYGIKSAMKKIYGLEGLPAPVEMERIAQPWRPYASVACWYLWRALDGAAEL
jgi:DNA-3-methyladenine glycosylase II